MGPLQRKALYTPGAMPSSRTFRWPYGVMPRGPRQSTTIQLAPTKMMRLVEVT